MADKSFLATLRRAGGKALGGGLPGAAAMVLQVVLLMWLRTAINYQMKVGCNTTQAFTDLYNEGGVGRFYRGAGFALMQGPLARFGDTAANEGVKELLGPLGLNVATVALVGSILAGLWRVVINPVGLMKTSLQTDGSLDLLFRRVEVDGFGVLFSGAIGTWVATAVGNFPWSFAYNWLDKNVPKMQGFMKFVRNGVIGLISSIASDICSNSIRVVTVKMQTSDTDIGYVGAAITVVDEDGVSGLLFRGLTIKLISNGVSAILFTILWKYLMEVYNAKTQAPFSAEKRNDAVAPDLVIHDSPEPPVDAHAGPSLRTRKVQAST